MASIKISKDFSEYPGSAKKEHGPFSGEAFYEEKLEPAFAQALKNNELLEVDLDDTFGYSSSFLRESFGRLAMDYGANHVLANLKIISYQEPDWKERIINDYIPKGEKRAALEVVV